MYVNKVSVKKGGLPVNIGFDNDKYVAMQSSEIKKRIDFFGGKLYLEFGGKLFDDYHASRVLPGFEPDTKVKMLLEIKEDVEIIISISASDIENNKIRNDHGITYDEDVLRLIDEFRSIGLYVSSVAITQYCGQASADHFKDRLNQLGINVYSHYLIEGYPYNVPLIVSEEGYGKDDYIPTERPLVVVTAPGPGSGKIATCLSQLYHDSKRGVKSGYAKFETFPIWNLPITHPVNLAYEAATADLNDVNILDPFHLEAYNKPAVNYNRDIEIFPVLNNILERILGTSPYKSPTDMGVNMAGFCIIDDSAVVKAANDEIIRRYCNALCNKKRNMTTGDEVYKTELIMKKAQISVLDRPVIAASLQKEEETSNPAAALMLHDGTIITGKTSSLLGASSAALLNALKTLGGINDDIRLISPVVIEPIQDLKINHLGNKNPRLHTDETLIALSICAATNPTAEIAISQLHNLHGCEMHSTVILSPVDENTLKKLGINLTCEPKYQTAKLFHK